MKKKSLFILLLVICVFILAGCKSTEDKYNDLIEEGTEYKGKNEIDKAISSFEEAKKLIPEKQEAYIEIYKIYGKNAEYDKALDILKEAEENVTDPEELKQIINKKSTLAESLLSVDKDNYSSLVTGANIAMTDETVYRRTTSGTYTIKMTDKKVSIYYNGDEVGSDDAFYIVMEQVLPSFENSFKRYVFSNPDYVIKISNGIVTREVYPQ